MVEEHLLYALYFLSKPRGFSISLSIILLSTTQFREGYIK